MVKPPVRLEARIIDYIGGSPWGLSGFATGHPPLPGYRRFIQGDEIREFDPELSCGETTSVVYDLRYQVEDVVADGFGILRQARILVALCVPKRVTDLPRACSHRARVGSSVLRSRTEAARTLRKRVPTEVHVR